MYRFDPYDQSIVIDGFENGVADSPYAGISDMRNVNIISVPGEGSVNFSTTAATMPSVSGTVTGASDSADTVTIAGATLYNGMCLVFTGGSLPTGVTAATKYLIKVVTPTTIRIYTTYANYVANSFVNIGSDVGTGTFASLDMGKPTNRFSNYIIDSNGRVWADKFGTYYGYLLGVDATTTTNANGNGIAVYRGYVFAFRNALIDYMLISTGVWTYAWQTMNTAAGVSNPHYAYLGQDDVIYYCDAAYVGSFFQKPLTTFDPGNTATYTWNQDALAIPSNDIANCLAELGVNLLVGGQQNAIYPWNRTSTSFSYPILLAESFIQRMVTVNTNTYILAGARGRVYITNGSQATLFKKIPDHISGTIEPFFQWGDLASNRNQIYFGVLAKTNAGAANSQYGGVWAIDLDSKALRLTNKLSYGTYAGLATVVTFGDPGTVGNPPFPPVSSGNGLTIGWDSGASTYGIDVPSSDPYTSSQTTIDSDLIPIGTYDKPRDLTRIEYKLSKPLVSGESITIKYRLIFNTSDTGYTTVLTDSTAGNYSLSGPINFKNAQWVQFQVVLNSTTSTPSYVRLKNIRITGIKETL